MYSHMTTLLATALLCVACASPVVPDDAVFFDARTQPELSASGGVAGSGSDAVVRLVVAVRNPDVRARQITLIALCTVVLRVYTTAVRSGFSSSALPGGCKALPWVNTLAAGTTKVLQEILGLGTILNPPGMPALPPGHYFFTAVVTVRELPAGSIELSAGEGDLQL